MKLECREHRRLICLILFSIMILIPVSSTSSTFVDAVEANVGKFKTCFVLKKIGVKEISVFNKEQCRTRYVPCSTFKILHSLIGLEPGILKDENTVFKWNRQKYPFKTWEQDHSLETAIKYSVVPCYQELARKIGKNMMYDYISKVQYGNNKIGDNIIMFWLDGPLKISAYEQLLFLERIYSPKMAESLLFSERNKKNVKSILVKRSGNGMVFSGKTGSDYVNGRYIFGWFVGHYKSKTGEYIFAVNIKGRANAKTYGKTAEKIAYKTIMNLKL